MVIRFLLCSLVGPLLGAPGSYAVDVEEWSLLVTKRTAFWLVLGKGVLGEQLEEED